MTPRDFALLAQEAYVAAPDIGKADSASRAIVRTTAAGLCIAFPGSDNTESWLADFDVLTVDVPGAGEVHQGFWSAWQAIAPEVLAAIGDKPVTLVGHSLGSSLATCAAVSMVLAGKTPAALFGFEPPRITPDLGVRTLLSKVPVHLFRNGLDLVPEVPPGWQHAALLTHIGKPALPFPNVVDHELPRVIASLATLQTSPSPVAA